MKYSIIIPLFNKEKGVLQSLNSVLAQSFSDYEIIIIDDGSTDDSIELVKSVNDDRIVIYSQENSGPSAARNTGIRISRGEWLLFLDADDELLPDALNTFNELIKRYPDYMAFCCNHMIETNGKTWLRSSFYPDGPVFNNYQAWFFNILLPCQGSTLLNRSILKKYKYPTKIRRWEDAALMFDIMRDYKFIRCHIPTFIYHRSLSEGMYARKDVNEDFCAHLDFDQKSFWEKMCLYKIMDESRKLYPNYNMVPPKDKLSKYFVPSTYKILMSLLGFISFIKNIKI